MLKPSRRKIIISTISGLAGITAVINKTQAQTQAQTQTPHNDNINHTINNPQAPQSSNIVNNSWQQTSNKIEIINTVNKIALMSDLRNWEEVIAQFTNQVEFDYTSIIGGEPITIRAKLQVKEWEESFAKSFKTTQHILGSHIVTLNSDRATCICNFQAHHVFLNPTKGQSWTLGGTYKHELTRIDNVWKVNKMKMIVNWEEGSRPF